MEIDFVTKLFEHCVLVAYPDPLTKGKPYTAGWGSTRKADGSEFQLGEQITQETADALLTDYFMKHIIPHFKEIPYPLTSDQKSALASCWYNIKGGFQAFKKSKCYEAICKKDWATIFREWDWGASQMKGLAIRRAYEKYLFLKDLK